MKVEINIIYDKKLDGNFTEQNIKNHKEEIQEITQVFRDLMVCFGVNTFDFSDVEIDVKETEDKVTYVVCILNTMPSNNDLLNWGGKYEYFNSYTNSSNTNCRSS